MLSKVSNRRSRRGLTLLITLVVIALAATMLTRLSAYSIQATFSARQEERRLQQKWSYLSARLAIKDQVEQLFEDSDAQSELAGIGWPYPHQIQISYELAGTNYELILMDEQAKLNLNQVYEHRPELLPSFIAMQRQVSGLTIPLIPNAAYPRLLEKDQLPFHSLGQILNLSSSSYRPKTAKSLVAFSGSLSTSQLTQLNLRRAPEDILRQTLQLVLTATETEELIDKRASYSGTLTDWMRGLDLPQRRRAPLRRLLTERSTSYSLWIVGEDRLSVSYQGERRGNSSERVLTWP